MTVTPIRPAAGHDAEGYDLNPHPAWCSIFTDEGGCSEHDSLSLGFIPATADAFARQAGTAMFPAVDVRGFLRVNEEYGACGPLVSLEVNWPVPCPHDLHPGQINGQVELVPDAAAKVANALRHVGQETVAAYDNRVGQPDVTISIQAHPAGVAMRFDDEDPTTMVFRHDEAAGLADVIDQAVALVTGQFEWLIPSEVYGRGAVAA